MKTKIIMMYSYGPPHMAVQKQDDQHEHTFSSYVRIRDVVLKTYLGRWTIGSSGERGSGISVLPARHDDDDDDENNNNNRMSKLHGDRDATINHISISECSKLVQKVYKTWYDWVRTVIYWELCKKLDFDHTAKYYMHRLESVREKETYTIL